MKKSYLIAGVVAVLLLVAVIVGVVVAVRSGGDSKDTKAEVVVNNRTCIERHLKAIGLLEKEYRSAYTDETGSSASDCKPLIEKLQKDSFEPFKEKIDSDPKSGPMRECLVPGLQKSGLADQIIAVTFFEKGNLNDPERLKTSNEKVANSVLSTTMECAMKMTGAAGSDMSGLFGMFGAGMAPPKELNPRDF